MLTRRRGNLLYRYDITKFSATDTSMCILMGCCDEYNIGEKCRLLYLLIGFDFVHFSFNFISRSTKTATKTLATIGQLTQNEMRNGVKVKVGRKKLAGISYV